MSNNLLTKHFKSEKKRVSVNPNEKKLEISDILNVTKKQQVDEVPIDYTISKPKTRRSRLNKKEIDKEYEKIINSNSKKSKINIINEEIKIPKTKIKVQKVQLDVEPKIEEPQVNTNDSNEKLTANLNYVKTPKKKKKLILNNSEQKDTFMKDIKDEVKTQCDSQPKDEKPQINDTTLQLIDKIKNKKGNLESERRGDDNTILHRDIVMPVSSSILEKKELSGKTLDILNRLKSERKNKFERSPIREREKSQSVFSLKFRFEELIQEKRQLILPPTFKNLINLFSDLESTINHYKLKKKRPILNEIQSNIEMTFKRKFDISHFKQILSVVPHFFIYEWEKIDNLSDYELLIDIPNDFSDRLKKKYDINSDMRELHDTFDPKDGLLKEDELELRKNTFHNLIINFVNEQHQKFLIECNIKDFNPLTLKTWHSGFDLKKVAPINEFPIKNKPINKIQTITEIIKENDIKSKCILYAFEELKNEDFTPQKHNENGNTNIGNSLTTPNLSKVISRSVYNKIKAKEEAIKMSKELVEYSLNTEKKKKTNFTKYKEFLFKIRDIFISKECTAIKEEEFFKKLLENFTQFYSLGEIDAIVNFFLTNFPNYLTCIETINSGKIYKIDKLVVLKDILEKLEKFDL